MRRVAVLGSGGAGKSTFARDLAQRLEVPLVSLDAHYWQPGWQRPDRDWWRAQQQRLLAGPAWVADGNYWSTLEVRLQRADTVVLLDLPRWVCTARVLQRTLRHRGRAVQAPGCPERISWQFLHYVWTFPRRHRPRVLAALAEAPPERFAHLRSQHDIDAFLAAASPR
ncbi:P-loop NTPase family protein [Salinifilum ghardaiensis]